MTADDHSFIQEIRLVSSGDNLIDYVVGAYYQREVGASLITQFIPGLQDYLNYIGQPNLQPMAMRRLFTTGTPSSRIAPYSPRSPHILRTSGRSPADCVFSSRPSRRTPRLIYRCAEPAVRAI